MSVVFIIREFCVLQSITMMKMSFLFSTYSEHFVVQYLYD